MPKVKVNKDCHSGMKALHYRDTKVKLRVLHPFNSQGYIWDRSSALPFVAVNPHYQFYIALIKLSALQCEQYTVKFLANYMLI